MNTSNYRYYGDYEGFLPAKPPNVQPRKGMVESPDLLVHKD